MDYETNQKKDSESLSYRERISVFVLSGWKKTALIWEIPAQSGIRSRFATWQGVLWTPGRVLSQTRGKHLDGQGKVVSVEIERKYCQDSRVIVVADLNSGTDEPARGQIEMKHTPKMSNK